MAKHLLITVGDDPNTLYGVRFVSSFFKKKQDVHLMLLDITPRFESMNAWEDDRFHAIDRQLTAIYSKKARQTIDLSKDILLDNGFLSNQIETKILLKSHGTVQDILLEAKKGSYDVLVLGRRGYSIFERTFSKSVSTEVMATDIDLPIWICRYPERGRKDVLLCVDGSETDSQIIDHVSEMLGGEDEHLITVFHDFNAMREEEAGEFILLETREKLRDNGIADERITTLAVHDPNIADAIVTAAEDGAYAAVAMGRSNKKESKLTGDWTMGSTCMRVLELLNKSALWVAG